MYLHKRILDAGHPSRLCGIISWLVVQSSENVSKWLGQLPYRLRLNADSFAGGEAICRTADADGRLDACAPESGTGKRVDAVLFF